MSQNFFETWKTKSNGNNFSKYSLIFAFSTILAGNKYIFTYLIRISIKIVQNKYTYWKKVSRRNPEPGEGPSTGLLRDYEPSDGTFWSTSGYSPWQCLLTDCDTTADTGGVAAWAPGPHSLYPQPRTVDTMARWSAGTLNEGILLRWGKQLSTPTSRTVVKICWF